MQSAELALTILRQKSLENEEYVFERLYRILFKQVKSEKLPIVTKDLYKGFSEHESIQLIEQLRSERVYMHGLSIKQKRILFQRVNQILCAIYEPLLFNRATFHQNNVCALKEKVLFVENHWQKHHRLLHITIAPQQLKVLKNSLIQLMGRKIKDGRLLNLLHQMIEIDMNPYDPLNQTNEVEGFKKILLEIWLYHTKLAMQLDTKMSLPTLFHGSEMLFAFSGLSREVVLHMDAVASYLQDVFKFMDSSCYRIDKIEKKTFFFAGFEFKRSHVGRWEPFMPQKCLNEKLKPYQKADRIVHISQRLHLSTEDLIQTYRCDFIWAKQFEGIVKNYNIRMKKFRHYNRYSLLKTLACKEKSSVKKILKKYSDQIKNQ